VIARTDARSVRRRRRKFNVGEKHVLNNLPATAANAALVDLLLVVFAAKTCNPAAMDPDAASLPFFHIVFHPIPVTTPGSMR